MISMLDRRRFIKNAGAAAFAVSGLQTALAQPQQTQKQETMAVAREVSGMRVQRLSWAAIKVEVNKTTVLVDACLDRSSLGAGELVPIDTTTELKYALVTHAHGDHYDPITIRQHLSKKGYAVAHSSLAPTVASDGVRVRPVGLNEPLTLRGGDVTVIAVNAVDGLGDPQVSWILTGGGRRVIHGGDTMWHGYWWNIGAAFGPFDIAFLPINGVKVQSRFPYSNLPASLTPEQAVAATRIMKAKVLCPIHYGGNDPPSYVEVPEALEKVKQHALEQQVIVRPLKPGEWITA